LGTKSSLIFCVCCIFSLSHAEIPYAIIGGQNGSGDYAALIPYLDPLLSISSLPTSGQINSVSINPVGNSIIGGTDSTGAYAALVSSTGTITALSSLPDPGQIRSVAIGATGISFIGGTNNASGYGAYISPIGVVTTASVSPLYAVDINQNNTVTVGGQNGAGAYSVLVSIPNTITNISSPTLPAAGIIHSVAINARGDVIIGGQNSTAAYAAFINTTGNITASSIPTTGNIYSVDINSGGVAIIAGQGGSAGTAAYAAISVIPGYTDEILGLPTTGVIYGAAINQNRAAVIGGQKDGTTPYAALVSAYREVTPIQGLPSSGSIRSVDIDSLGVALIVGQDGSSPYAALVSPSGIANILPNLPSSGILYSVDIGGTFPTPTIGPFISGMANLNALLASSFALNNHVMIQHKQSWLKKTVRDENVSLLVADKFGENYIGQTEPQAKKTRFSFWVEPFYDATHQKTYKTTPSSSNQIFGTIAGLDYKQSEGIVLGAAAAYTYNMTKISDGVGDGNINQEMATFYSSFQGEKLFFNMSFWGGLYQTEYTRYNYNIIHTTSKAKTDGWVFSPHFELSTPYRVNHKIFFEQFFMVDWVNNLQKHFTETSPSGFSLILRDRYCSLLRSELGFRCYQIMEYGWGQFFIEEKISYVNQAPFYFDPIQTYFVGPSSSFSISTTNSSVQNLAGLELHFSFVPWNAKIPYGSIDFQGEFGSTFQSYFALLEIGQRF